jgi:undecaprenyl-diphosphatase
VIIEPITGIAAVDWLLAIMDSWGYLIVLGMTTAENVFIVGSFTPGETAVLAGGFMASRGSIDAWGVWSLATVGSVLGSNISYWLGRRGGRDALLRYGHRFHISEKRIAGAEEYFSLHGSKTVFIARWAAGVKNFVPMIAGVARMSLFWFEVYSLLSAALYATMMVLLGYFFGQNFEALLDWLARAGWGGLALIAILIVLSVWNRRRRRAKLVALAENAENAETETHSESSADRPR